MSAVSSEIIKILQSGDLRRIVKAANLSASQFSGIVAATPNNLKPNEEAEEPEIDSDFLVQARRRVLEYAWLLEAVDRLTSDDPRVNEDRPPWYGYIVERNRKIIFASDIELPGRDEINLSLHKTHETLEESQMVKEYPRIKAFLEAIVERAHKQEQEDPNVLARHRLSPRDLSAVDLLLECVHQEYCCFYIDEFLKNGLPGVKYSSTGIYTFSTKLNTLSRKHKLGLVLAKSKGTCFFRHEEMS